MKYKDVAIRHLKPGHHKRTGLRMTPRYITIHNTGNPASTADGERRYLDNPANTSTTAWHIVVDDKTAIEAIPLDQVAYHAGDGKSGVGNTQSIGIEICESGNYAQAEQNAVELVADLLNQNGWGVDHVKAHRDWSGKDCPHLILPHWDEFIGRVKEVMIMENVPDWQIVAIKAVCAKYGMDEALWLGKAAEPVTVGELFGVLNKVR